MNSAPTSKFKYTVKSSGMVAKSSPLVPAKNLVAPFVQYSTKAHRKIQIAVETCPKEVGWFGTVEVVKGGYLITDIFIPKQTVSAVETDIEADALAEIACSIDNPEDLYYWGHSHVHMPVTPSGQDDLQTEEYLDHAEVFIRGIYNKGGTSKVDVFDVANNMVHECVRDGPVIPNMSEEEIKAFKAIISSNVKSQIPPALKNVYPPYGGYKTPKNLHVVGRSKSNPFLVTNQGN